jgi:hypothetical protein
LHAPGTWVGASTLAMDVNDDAGCLDARGALVFFASVLAPTGAVMQRQCRIQRPQGLATCAGNAGAFGMCGSSQANR